MHIRPVHVVYVLLESLNVILLDDGAAGNVLVQMRDSSGYRHPAGAGVAV
jgi:hypothetical protein